MKTLVKRMAVMSVALILLCVGAVAQNEKSTKNTRNGSYGVTVSPNYVLLMPGEEIIVTITPEAGYAHPFLIYDGSSFQIADVVVGDSFIACLLDDGRIFIQANSDAKEIDSDVIYVRALPINEDRNVNTRAIWGAPIVITVDPTLKKQKTQAS